MIRSVALGTCLGLAALGALVQGGASARAAARTADLLAPLGFGKPPAIAARPVTETLWGRKVTDEYRFMEALDPPTIGWMKAQGNYTRAILDSIGPRQALARRIAAFTASFGFIQDYAAYGGRAFYEERTPGSDNFDLIVKDDRGRRKIVDVAALRAAHGGNPYAINYFLAAPDGSKVAVGISEGGSEAASISVYDAGTGALIAGPVDRAQAGATAWSNDSRELYFIRLKKLAPEESPTHKFFDATLLGWDLKGEPLPILGSTVGHGPHFESVETPALTVTPTSPVAVAIDINGVQNELALWLAPASQVRDPKLHWKPFVGRDDDVNSFDAHGDQLFLLSHRNAPTFQVLGVTAGQQLAAARVLVPAKPDRVIDSIHAAADGLYVLARQGAYSRMLRMAYGSGAVEEVALPFEGHVDSAFTDPSQPGISVALSSWVVPPTEFSYDPLGRRFTDLKLGTRPPLDASGFVVRDLQARARDGVMVPLSLVQPKGVSGPQIVLIQAYGSYGISQLADFSPRAVSFLLEGGSYASCHVRGGGELGDAWRLAGKDRQKPNTWRDLIACGEDLIARGVTTKDKLFIFGGSAGGITMGRAMTERPDLFAGVIDAVPAANTLRSEFSPNGPDNIPEFGSITRRDGFADLFMDDSVQHVRKGVRYPAVMITTGLNDPRVAPWEPAKLAATLQASGTPDPVLLRIDAKAGHGIGSTKTQNDELYADMYSFVFWRAGRPGWRPDRGAGG